MRFGILSILNDPFLGYLIRELVGIGISPSAIILDSKDVSEKDAKIYQQRLAGRLPRLPLHDVQSGVPFYFVESHNSEACRQLIEREGLELLLNGGTPRILKRELLRAPREGILNVHPGMLPHFRGCTCVEWAIYMDGPVGNSVYFMDENIDGGPIVMQESLRFSKTDTYVDVRVKVSSHGNKILAKAAHMIVKGEVGRSLLSPQEKGTYYKVIDQDKMAVVMEKLRNGKYKYQISDGFMAGCGAP